jgi:uracil-DNA glycosylase family 4
VNVAEDQIYERYQAKAIAEINALGHDIAEWLRETHPGAAPVLGTGHPLADILLLKYSPLPAETQEGVAFFGRSGQAILKSLQRLRIDPLMLYGTDCVKAAVDPADADLAQCRLWLTREIHITQPRMIVAMGDAAHAFLDSIGFPLSVASDGTAGEIQQWTPTIELLPTPDIDECLDSSQSKQAFWAAFRALGDWYENLPPY